MTIDEIKEAVKGEPTLLDGIIEYSNSTDKGKVILTNHANVEFDKRVGTKVGELYSNIDKDIKEALGDEKPQEMKTYDYVKKLSKELRGFRDNGSGDDALKAEVLDLKAKLKDGNGKHWHDTYNKGLETWTEKENQYKDQIGDFETKLTQTMVTNEIAKGLSGIKLNTSIPESVQKIVLDNAVSLLSANAKIVEGKVVLQKDGEPWMNQANFLPIDAGSALREILKDSIEARANTGGQSNSGSAFGNVVTLGEGDKTKKHVNLDKSKILSQEQFAEHFDDAMVEKGIGRGTKEWFQMEAETMKQMGVEKLPVEI